MAGSLIEGSKMDFKTFPADGSTFKSRYRQKNET